MATVRHAFESAKDDPVDATLIGATEWNDAGAHVVEGFDLPYINVMDPEYGAVGDGVADDTAAIQAAITATGWPAQAGTVLFPVSDGFYNVTSSIMVDGAGALSTPELHFISDGAMIGTTTAGIAIFTVTNSVISTTRVKFRGLFFNINAASTGILFNNAELCAVTDCDLGGSFSTGIKFTGTSTYNRVEGNAFANMARGLHLNGGAHYLRVIDNTFGEELSGSPLNWIESDSGAAPPAGVEIIGNTFYSPGGTLPALRILNGGAWTITGNHFTRSPREAVWIGGDGSSYGHVIIGNTFQNDNRHDIYIDGGRGNIVVGNTFGPRDNQLGVVPDNTYANVRIANTAGGTAGNDNIVIGNRSMDTAAALTYVVEADAACQNLTVIGNSGLAGISAPHVSNLVINGVAGLALLTGSNAFVGNNTIDGTLSMIGSDGYILLGTGLVAGGPVLYARASGDSQNRLKLDNTGQWLWGSGALAGDTNLKRLAANSLGTDDQFSAADGLVGKYKSGAGVTNLADGDFTVTPADGATGAAHNTTDGKSYYCARANGTWKSVEVA